MRFALTTVLIVVCLMAFFFACGCAQEPPTVKTLKGESQSWKAEAEFVNRGDNITVFITLNPQEGIHEGPLSATMVMDNVSGSVTLDVDNKQLDPPLVFQRRLELSPEDIQAVSAVIDITWAGKTKQETISLH